MCVMIIIIIAYKVGSGWEQTLAEHKKAKKASKPRVNKSVTDNNA